MELFVSIIIKLGECPQCNRHSPLVRRGAEGMTAPRERTLLLCECVIALLRECEGFLVVGVVLAGLEADGLVIVVGVSVVVGLS